jgi:hypothetical protein
MRVHPEQPDKAEGERLAGALDLLGNVRAELMLRRDEVNNDSARETLDETLSLLASLDTEYRRRYERASPARPEHASFVFLLDADGSIHPLPHGLYVAMAKGEATAPEFAGRRMRVADWYVRLSDAKPVSVVNETYAPIAFDSNGRPTQVIQPSAERAGRNAWLPTRAERAQMRARLFGATPESTPSP